MNTTMLMIFIVLAIWEMVWKGIALWKAGKNNQLTWFVFIFIFNTIGILPMLYIFVFSKKKKTVSTKQVVKAKPKKAKKK